MGVLSAIGDFGLEALKQDTIDAKDLTLTYRNQTEVLKVAAENLVNNGITFKGSYNPQTNIPALTSTPNEDWPDGAYFEITPVGGALPIDGENFDIGQAVNPGDRLKKIGSAWSLVKSSLGPESVGPTELRENGVSFEKTDLFKSGVNRFNLHSDYNLVGTRIDTSNTQYADGNFNTTHFIPVQAGDTVSIGPLNEPVRKLWYNESKIFISALNNNTNPVTAPAGAKYLRVSMDITLNSWAGLMIVIASSIPASFVPYRAILSESNGTAIYADKLLETTTLTATNVGLVASPNIFNYQSADNKYGKITSVLGVEADDEGYNTSHLIPVAPGQNIAVSINQAAINVRKLFYSQYGTFISGSLNSTLPNVVPPNASYMRISVELALYDWTKIMVEVSTTPHALEPYVWYWEKMAGVDIIAKKADRATVAGKAESVDPAAIMAPGSIGLVTSPNIFNYQSVDNKMGKVTSVLGVEGDNAEFNTSHFLTVSAGQSVYVHINGVAINVRKLYYSQFGTFISGSLNSTMPNVAPVNTGLMRICVELALYDWTKIVVEIGSSSGMYRPFGLISQSLSTIPIAAKLAERALLADKATSAVSTDALAPSFKISGENLSMTGGKNLFNIDHTGGGSGDNLETSYINNDAAGAIIFSANHKTTHYMPVNPGEPIYPQTDTGDGGRVNWYNASKTWIGGVSLASGSYATAPSNAAYARVSINITSQSWPTLMVSRSTTHQTWEKYGWEFKAINGVEVNPDIPNPTAPVISPKIYIPQGKELAIYYENLNKNYYKEGSHGRTIVNISGASIYGKSTRYVAGGPGSMSCSVEICDDDYKVRKTIPFTIQRTNNNSTSAKKVYNIGDSYTLRSGFLNVILGSAAATGLTFHGMRNSTGADPTMETPAPLNINHEGRGGWTLFKYMTFSNTIFNPFMQPVSGAYKYYGNTSYWKDAVTYPTDGAGHYDTFNVDSDILALYNGSTGYLIAPNTDDVMYDNTLAAYRRWDGSAWVSVSMPGWGFSFAKYRDLYGFPAADVVHLLLGTNDFASSTYKGFEGIYASFKDDYDEIIASVKADNIAARIIIGVPVSSGKVGEDGIHLTELRKALFWRLAGQLYADYGGREGEGIYIADYHSTVDREYGFYRSEVLPFNQYTGDERESHTVDSIHVSPDGFNQMGNIYMGAIQNLR